MVTDARLARRGRVVLLRMDRFLRRGIWEADYRRLKGPIGVLIRQLQVVLLAIKGMKEDEVRLRSASLSLITLLSVVPFLAVIFWVFQALGGVEDLRSRVEPFIYESLAVGAQEEAIAWLNQFIAQIHTGAVGGIGTGILLVAAIGLLASMEESFNRVWAVPRGRPLLTRFVIYWCLLTVGPLLLAASLGGTAAIQGWLPLGEWFVGPAFAFVPVIITIGAFTLLYMVIPHTQVLFRHALVGGVTAGLLFEAAKHAYAWIAGHLFHHHAIYGSLGAIPVFIIWVNITWLIVLLGCELTFANQNVGTLRHEERARAANQQTKELVACRLMLEIALDFYRGSFPPSASVLSSRLEAPIRLVRTVLESLRKGGLVLEASGNRLDAGFVPAREISRVTIGDVIWAMRMRQTGPFDMTEDDRQAQLRALLGRADEAAADVYRDADFLSLARRFVDGAAEGTLPAPVSDAI